MLTQTWQVLIGSFPASAFCWMGFDEGLWVSETCQVGRTPDEGDLEKTIHEWRSKTEREHE